MAARLHTIEETGVLLGEISPKSVRRLIAAGDLESCDVAPSGCRKSRTRVSDDAIARFIADRTRKAKALRTP